MPSSTRLLRRLPLPLFALFALLGTFWLSAQNAHEPFEQLAEPFLEKNCVVCHNVDNPISGIRVDQLDGTLADRRIRLWEAVRRNVASGAMPPEGVPQPSDEERQRMVEWIDQALDVARARPVPKNGLVRRLTVAQYRNTLQQLLGLDDDLTDILPPDAVSKDGFVNNAATLELSPLLMEAYFEIAAEALSRAIVDPDSKPAIQSFRVELGRGVNPAPLPEKLILGANSLLLDNADYRVTELAPDKPFPFEHRKMRTSYRFIEGYKGNATVRGWRDFNSIYHAVFADMRGSRGYPKGDPYATVAEGLLLRPAIPTDELFGSDGTYGPKANFKISLRELPDHGRFRVRVRAAKYDDGLLLDPGEEPQPARPGAIVWRDPAQPTTLEVPAAGLYQVDVYERARATAAQADSSRLDEGLAGAFDLDGDAPGKLEGGAKLVESPLGQALSLDGQKQSLSILRQPSFDVGEGDFTVAAWIHPRQLKNSGIVVLGGFDQASGWRLALSTNRGAFSIATTRGEDDENGMVVSPQRVIRKDAWQHVAAVVRREPAETLLFVNGYRVARGKIGRADLSNPKADLHIGRVSYEQHFHGEIDGVRLYRRALEDAEVQALVEPGRELALRRPNTPQRVSLELGGRPFSRELEQPAFVALRLPAGALAVSAERTGVVELDRVVLTRLEDDHDVTRRFEAFEKRVPRLGVFLGLRRDCGSTFAPVEEPRSVPSGELQELVFEGAIQNYPSPDVEKDNVNYLAGIREIAVHSIYTDGRDMPRLLVRSVELEGPFYETWPPRSHQSVFLASNRKHDADSYARTILSDFAARAYRRPASDAEVATLMSAYRGSLESGGSFQDGVKDALQVALTSPQFLFLVETSQTPRPELISDHELASKLSYFLWNGPPDTTTLGLAARGELRANLDAEVERMIADERFSRFAEQFASQWLSLDKFDVLEPDRERFPHLTRAARGALRSEPVRFLQHLIENDLPVRNLVRSDFVIANEVTASYYGLGDRTERGLEFIPIVHGRPELGGLISQAAIMAGLSDGRESNPVKRGAWLARKIVAEPPDDPPPNVPDLANDTEGLSLRKRLEAHRSQPGCRQCHTKIDPWGVAFEGFDADGRLKSEPADARSTLPDGTEVDGIHGLRDYLAEDRIDQVAFSVLKHLMIYANGRDLSYKETNDLKAGARRLRASDYRLRQMIRYVVNSDIFLQK